MEFPILSHGRHTLISPLLPFDDINLISKILSKSFFSIHFFRDLIGSNHSKFHPHRGGSQIASTRISTWTSKKDLELNMSRVKLLIFSPSFCSPRNLLPRSPSTVVPINRNCLLAITEDRKLGGMLDSSDSLYPTSIASSHLCFV